MGKLISKIPDGSLAQKWTKYKASVKLVNPANKKKLEIIVIGTGLSGAGAASALGELGYSVKNFCYQDSPRRAHSVAAQDGTIYYMSTLAVNSNASAAWKVHKKGAFFANPSFIQIHPTCVPQLNEFQSKLTLMSESLRNDGRVWVPKTKSDTRPANEIPEEERDYYLERRYPAFGNLVPRDVASREAKERCDAGFGVGETGLAVNLDFRDSIKKQGKKAIENKYGNLFEMYKTITGIDQYEEPMRIYPAGHYTMGGLWVDYELMTTIPRLYAIGEANFSDHGANRLGASSLMQASCDGYFILPNTINNYLADEIRVPKISTDKPEFEETEKAAVERLKKLISIKGKQTASSFHKRLGKIMWDYCGMIRNEEGLKKALVLINDLKEEFWKDLIVPGTFNELNMELEKAGRVADYFELAELLVTDALNRNESCGAHFREEFQTPDGEALRNDEKFAYVAAWEYAGEGKPHILHKEELKFEEVEMKVRSYK